MTKPHDPVDRDTERTVDNFTSSVETLLTGIAQRRMSDEQIERLARVLQRAERNLLARSTTSPAPVRRTRPAAASRSGSRKAA